MLNTKFTQATNTNTKEESKMKNLKEEMLNIYNLVNESRISKENGRNKNDIQGRKRYTAFHITGTLRHGKACKP